jgi:hypothetical protein
MRVFVPGQQLLLQHLGLRLGLGCRVYN